jgi:hypothetical protein
MELEHYFPYVYYIFAGVFGLYVLDGLYYTVMALISRFVEHSWPVIGHPAYREEGGAAQQQHEGAQQVRGQPQPRRPRTAARLPPAPAAPHRPTLNPLSRRALRLAATRTPLGRTATPRAQSRRCRRR